MTSVRRADVLPGFVRLVVGIVVGAVVAIVVGLVQSLALALLCGLATMALVYVVASARVLYPMDAESTAAHARREDSGRVVNDGIVLLAAVGSVAGIVLVALLGRSSSGQAAALVALVGVFCAWAMLHTTFAVRYARAFYDASDPGGIDFNADGYRPRYTDFYYFSFNLGMTYQVSDTSVTSGGLRRLVLQHCLLSYVFGTVLLAATINLVAGIAIGS